MQLDPQQLDEIRKTLESQNIGDRIQQVDALLQRQTHVNAYQLGLKLALTFAQEIETGATLGSLATPLVQSWVGQYPPSIVEDGIAFARQFLLNPKDLANQLASRIFEVPKDN